MLREVKQTHKMKRYKQYTYVWCVVSNMKLCSSISIMTCLFFFASHPSDTVWVTLDLPLIRLTNPTWFYTVYSTGVPPLFHNQHFFHDATILAAPVLIELLRYLHQKSKHSPSELSQYQSIHYY